MDDRASALTPARTEQLADAWRIYPHTFAAKASRGRWVPYSWLRYLSLQLGPAIVEGGARIIVTAPPQHGKSEFISHWIPTWFFNLYNAEKVILAAYSADYAKKWGSAVREELSENPLAHVPLRQDSRAKDRFVTKAGGQMITAGIGGKATGEGAGLFVIDDPVKNYQDAMSPTLQERNFDWYKTVARTRLSSKGSIILLQTRWADGDLAGRLIQHGGFRVINLQALCDDPAMDPLGRAKGEALCPERYDVAALESIRKDVGEIVWDAMFQGNPSIKGGDIVKGEWIQFYDQLPAELDETALFADLSYKEGEENDFADFELWGRKGSDIYLIDQVRKQMGFVEQCEAFLELVARYPDAFHREIEEKANGAALLSMLKDKVPGLVANNPKTSKGARLATVAPLYKAGNVHYPKPIHKPWVAVNLYEIVRMSLSGSRAAHDDTVDVASMAVAHLGRMSSIIARLQALNRW